MTPAPAGYSGRPLPDKLGMKDGQRALYVCLPDDLADLPAARAFASCAAVAWDQLPAGAHFDFVQAFTTNRTDLADNAGRFRDLVMPAGMVWICWPKKSSKVPTDITEDTIREVFLPVGMVDVKVCAVTDIWSGLKLVVRKKLRGA